MELFSYLFADLSVKNTKIFHRLAKMKAVNKLSVSSLSSFLYLSCVLLCSRITSADTADTCPQNCTCNWRKGIVNCSSVNQIPTFRDRSLLHELILSPNNLTELKKDDFVNFTKLKTLDITRGSVQTIAENAFDGIQENIERIDLNYNQIRVIPSNVFKDMPKLKNIEINYNRLTDLNGSLFENLPTLNFIKFEFNAITQVGDEIFQNVSSLETVYFSGNNLTQIPYKSLQNVPALKHLYLNFNNITGLGDCSFQWPNLANISLDTNQLSNLTAFPNIAPNLFSLDIQFNNFSAISSSVWTNLTSLSSLTLNGNKMTSLTSGIFRGLPNVTHLFLRNMPVLETIGARVFSDLKSIRYVDASSCPKLKYIHEDAFKYTALTHLYLDHNNLTTLTKSELPLLTIQHLGLYNNSWTCDCKLRWILDPNIEFKSAAVKTEIKGLTCSSPIKLKGKHINSLSSSDLLCGSQKVPGIRSRFATGAVVAIVCLVVMTTFGLLFKFRKRIAISVRKYYQYRRFKNDAIFTVGNESVDTELDDVDRKRTHDIDEETVQLTIGT